MALVHRHSPDGKSPKLPTIARPFAAVGSGWVMISRAGKTPLWSTGFSGCIGVVMAGSGPWGAMAHLNQHIQDDDQSIELALSTLVDFVNAQTKDKVKEALLYYGDQGSNRGERQGSKLDEAKVKEVMKCQKLIDLRRTGKYDPDNFLKTDVWGSDFVYDPGLQIVYTALGAQTGNVMGLYDIADTKALNPAKTPFPYPSPAVKKKVIKGLGYVGWCFVP